MPKVTQVLIAALVLVVGALVVDRRNARSDEDPAWDPRVAQRQQLRFLGAYITDYGRRFGRPAFHLDSVEIHLDSATRAKFSEYRTDIWGDRVYYMWDVTTFTLVSRGGLRQDQRERREDSIAAAWKSIGRPVTGWDAIGRIQRRVQIIEEYWWPEAARGRRNSLGQFTQAPADYRPIIVR